MGLKRRGEAKDHEGRKPSSTLFTKNSEAIQLRGTCYLVFLLLLPPLNSNLFKTSSTSFRTKWDFEMERDVRSEVLASSKYP